MLAEMLSLGAEEEVLPGKAAYLKDRYRFKFTIRHTV